MRKNKKNKYLLLLVLLLGISIGFAALSTQLKINGTANITKNSWSVYWDEESIAITSGSKGNTEPDVVNGDDGSSNTKVTWEVTLDLPGDFYEFTIDAANAGTVDAMITGITPTVPSNLPSYISYSVTYADGTAPAENHLLAKGTKSGNTIIPTTEKYKVRVEYLDTVTPDDLEEIDDEGDTYQFSYSVTYSQATDAVIPAHPTWTLPEGRTKDNLQVGDEICLAADTTQCFYFIRYDGNDAVMLAKYNLNVGANAKGTATNKQDADVDGDSYGYVQFSESAYWGGSYPLDIYDPERFAGAPGESNYSIAYYVEIYKSILEANRAIIKEARLLTWAELSDESIGCTLNGYSGTCPTNSFITNSRFWLGSAWRDNTVSCVVHTTVTQAAYQLLGEGVRPVIVVEKGNL